MNHLFLYDLGCEQLSSCTVEHWGRDTDAHRTEIRIHERRDCADSRETLLKNALVKSNIMKILDEYVKRPNIKSVCVYIFTTPKAPVLMSNQSVTCITAGIYLNLSEFRG